MAQKRGKSGKHANLERMERAAVPKALGYGWADVSRLCKIPYRTLMTWAKDPTFQAMVAEAQVHNIRLRQLAELVSARQLEAGLNAKYTKRDAARVADRLLSPAPGQDGESPAIAGGAWYVEYPPRDQGLESKPTSEVLLNKRPAEPPPDAPTSTASGRKPPPKPAPKADPRKRRRIVAEEDVG